MAAVLLPSTKLALNVFAALEGQKAGNANLTGHKAFIDANGSAAYTAALEGHFAPTSDADLANSLLTNLGLGSLFTQAQAEAFLAGNPGNRVGAILALADQLYDYNGTDAALLSAHNTYKASVDGAYEYSINPANVASAPLVNDPGTISLNGADTAAGTAAGGEVLHITGDQSVRIDITNPANQIKGLDLNGDGVIAADGVENNITGKASLFEIIDAYARNPLNETDRVANFLGDIRYDGTGFGGDGVSTDGNIVLGGLGADTILGGIGNDFLAGGGVAAANGGSDRLDGGRNADFFFAELSLLDNTDGNNLTINGGSTTDDAAVGNNTPQDADWLLLEASDDEDGTVVNLADGSDADGLDENDQSVTTGAGQGMTMTEVENVDASGNLYGFLDDVNVAIGGGGKVVNGENVGIGASAQLNIIGSLANNILIGGYDNDLIEGNGGSDLLMGGNLNYSFNNPNAVGITNNGMDELIGGSGADNIVFEADGGIIEGGSEIDVNDADVDTLWLTRESLGASANTAANMTTDSTLRFDLGAGKEGGYDNYAGYGGADAGGTAAGYTADQTNYASSANRVQVQDMENVIATGLGAVDYKAAGSNDPELNFNNQQNHFAYNGNLDLRGTTGSNTLYAAAGSDVIEGREGNDMLSGGEGNDDFLFQLFASEQQMSGGSVGGDGQDIIHRQTDLGNNLTDGTFGRDFGLGGNSTTGPSSLSVDFSAANLASANVEMSSFSLVIGGVTFAVTDHAALAAVTTVADLATLVNTTFQAQDANVTVTAVGTVLTVTDATPTGGRDISITQADGYAVSTSVTAPGTSTLGLPVYVAPGQDVAQDRLLFVAYQDRADNERVDDDAVFGGDTLGVDNYAQDLVVGFDQAGSTVVAEDQAFQVNLTNLAVQDIVTVTVNGVQYSLQVGKALDNTLIANETTGQFALRLSSYINAFLDDDTAAGKVTSAGAVNGGNTGSFVLTQATYSGEQTVFMQVGVDVADNSSLGERATGTVTNLTETEVTLFQFDGRDNALNAENVLFLGDSGNSRAVLETAADAGGNLFGSDAIVVNVTPDVNVASSAAEGIDGAAIFFNTAENPTTGSSTNYAIHGDDQLFGGDRADVVRAGTGDDRVYGSLGLDNIDGGKDLYLVDGVIRVLNGYEATQVDALPSTLSIELITDGAFDDTLVYQQSDFGVVGAGGAAFEITLDLSANQANGGAGKVVVDGSAANTALFTNMENIRTVSGNGTLAGQGNDTLDLSVSVDPLTGVETANGFNMRYDLTSAGTAGNVDLDANDNGSWAVGETISRVDGVENVLFGAGDDVLLIDETEAGKNNTISGGLGDDTVDYSFDIAATDSFNPAVTLTVNGGGSDEDWVDMAGGSLKAGDVPRDTLTSVETINFGDALQNPSLDDVLDVTNVSDAVVDFVNGEVRNGSGVVQVSIGNMADFEVVNADFNDTVIVASTAGMNNSRMTDDNVDVQFDSFLNYDSLNATLDRQTIGDLRANNAALPVWENIGLYQFNLGQDSDTVDYSNETGLIAAVAQISGTTSSVGSVFVAGNSDLDVDSAGPGVHRVDALTGTENIVASQGASILDLTQAGQDLKITFNADNGPTSSDAALDRDVYRILLSELNSTAPITGMNFLEYRDAGDSATVTQATATWNQVEGSDFAERLIMSSIQSTENVTMNLRGGANEVKYNELTRSITSTLSASAFDANNPTTTGLISVSTTFQDGDGNPLPGTGTHVANSYAVDNGIASGTLRVAASQDAEDTITVAGTSNKLFFLAEQGTTDNQITVKLGSGAALNTIVLTGYEVLGDAASDDAYDIGLLSSLLAGLTLSDTLGDHDAIVVGNDTVVASTINLDSLNIQLTFDFDVLDVTKVTTSGLTLLGTADVLSDEAVLGALSKVTSISGFESVVLTDASVAAGDTFTLNSATGVLSQGSTNVTLGTNVVSFGGLVRETAPQGFGQSYINDVATAVNVTVSGSAATEVHGGAAGDSITGGGGNDIIRGNGGNDVLDGGIGAEVREVNVQGIMDLIVGGTVDLSFNGSLGVTLTEGTEIVVGAGNDAVGAALANAVNANLAAINVGAAWTNGSLSGASYDNGTDLLTFSFGAGVDVLDGEAITAVVTDAGTLAISAETIVSQGSDGGANTFVFEATAAGNGADTINNFKQGALGDVLDFTAFLGAPAVEDLVATNFVSAGLNLTGQTVGIVFNKATLSASDISTAVSAAAVTLANNAKAVVLTTADADGVADATNNAYSVYFVEDTDTSAGTAFAVTLVGTLNSTSELTAASFNAANFA